MKLYKIYLVLIALMTIISSCHYTELVTTSIPRSSDIILPDSTSGIIIFNRVVEQQQEGNGLYINLEGKSTTFNSEHQGISNIFTYDLIQALSDSDDMLPEIFVYNDSASEISKCYNNNRLTYFETKAIKEGHDNDAIISIDKISVKPILKDTIIYDYGSEFLSSTLDIPVSCSYTLYTPYDTQTYTKNDVLSWQEIGTNIDDIHGAIPSLSEAYYMISEHMSNWIASMFLPSYININRILYRSSSPYMNDAWQAWQSEDYEKAYKMWKDYYDLPKTKTEDKAKMANNIAIYYDKFDDYDNTVLWIDNAIKLFEKAGASKHSTDISNLKQFRSEFNRIN